jgi:uncharacterized membrane protein YgcG
MGSIRRACVGTFAATLVAGSTIVFSGAPAAEAAGSVRLHQAIRDLPVASETRSGYDRDKFRHWTDANGDCQDTRSEVLRQETSARITGACTVVTGRWKSIYDGLTWTQASDVDIDHLVPLAEAWDSGAKKWSPATRRAYANDLGDARSLIAMTDNLNQSKGDKDPAQWMPGQRRCTYVAQWVAVKIRWSLKVDQAEKRALKNLGGDCRNVTIKVSKAKVVTGGSAGSGSGSSSGGGSGSGGGGLDPRFPYCTDAKAAGYGPYYEGQDPEYDWYRDADSDGIVCE